MNNAWQNIWTITKKELKSCFNGPLAWVLIVVYLLFAGFFTFKFGGLLEYQNASLAAFFLYQPWLFMVLAPALGMRLWSEEHRLGTMELLMTMPIKPWHAIAGKFLAASAVLFLCIALTFPVWITVNWLGDPDNGIIISGYIAAFLVAVSFLAVTGVFSALTRSQVVCFIIALTFCFFLIIAGWPNVIDALNGLTIFGLPVGEMFSLGETLAPFSVLTHYNELTKGILVSSDILFYVSLIGFCLFLTSVILKTKRA